MSFGAKASTLGGRAPVLPHDGGRDRLQGLAVPQDQRLALVRDPDRAHVAGFRGRRLQRLPGARLHRVPDLVGVVLDPTWARVVLSDLAVTLAEDLTVETDRDRGGSGRAFVER